MIIEGIDTEDDLRVNDIGVENQMGITPFDILLYRDEFYEVIGISDTNVIAQLWDVSKGYDIETSKVFCTDEEPKDLTFTWYKSIGIRRLKTKG